MIDLIRERRGCMENAPSLQYLVLICFVWAPRISTPTSPSTSLPLSTPLRRAATGVRLRAIVFKYFRAGSQFFAALNKLDYQLWIRNNSIASLNGNLSGLGKSLKILVGPVRLPETGLVWAEQTPAVCSAFTRPPTPCLPSHTHTHTHTDFFACFHLGNRTYTILPTFSCFALLATAEPLWHALCGEFFLSKTIQWFWLFVSQKSQTRAAF